MKNNCGYEMLFIVLIFAGVIWHLAYPTTKDMLRDIEYDSRMIAIEQAVIRDEVTKRDREYYGESASTQPVMFDSEGILLTGGVVGILFIVALYYVIKNRGKKYDR